MSKRMPKNNKIHRQLFLYELIHKSQEVTMGEMINILHRHVPKQCVCQKTIKRDITDLTDAGLVQLEYNRKDNVYSSLGGSDVINAKEGTSRYLYLQKLRRLAVLLVEWTDISWTNDDDYNCKESYQEWFPGVSERTRFRDYDTLSRMGFSIRWDPYYKCHRIGKYYDIHDGEEF